MSNQAATPPRASRVDVRAKPSDKGCQDRWPIDAVLRIEEGQPDGTSSSQRSQALEIATRMTIVNAVEEVQRAVDAMPPLRRAHLTDLTQALRSAQRLRGEQGSRGLGTDYDAQAHTIFQAYAAAQQTNPSLPNIDKIPAAQAALRVRVAAGNYIGLGMSDPDARQKMNAAIDAFRVAQDAPLSLRIKQPPATPADTGLTGGQQHIDGPFMRAVKGVVAQLASAAQRWAQPENRIGS